MTYINILNEETQVQCTKIGNFYDYFIKEDGSEFNVGKHDKSPLELTRQTNIGKQIYQRIVDNLTPKQLKEKEKIIVDLFLTVRTMVSLLYNI